jgi:UDP-glucuronate 4-epimerase
MINTIIITGSAGFIGFHLCNRLLNHPHTESDSNADVKVIGFDNLNDYYDPALKQSRLDILAQHPNFTFIKGDLSEANAVNALFTTYRPDIVVNLAAQAGVRYSITNPKAYIDSNIVGFFNILEACRHSETLSGKRIQQLLYASSSSVYGNQQKTPFSTDDDVSYPISLYAATKKSNELMAYTYSHLYGIPTTGLRFFTVYGPYGRPDMAYFSFTNKLVKGEPIKIFNNGDMKRDFTYVDDIVQGIVNMLDRSPVVNNGSEKTSPAAGVASAAVYNIGNNKPEDLLHFVETLENCLMAEGVIDKPAVKEFLPMQPGDVYQTYADAEPLMRDFGFKPSTPIEEGLSRFAKWYKAYYIEGKR